MRHVSMAEFGAGAAEPAGMLQTFPTLPSDFRRAACLALSAARSAGSPTPRWAH